MARAKKIVYVAHCILNQNAVVREWERAQGAFNDIIRVLLDNKIAIIQMPCPEFTYLGENRPPKTKDEYDVYDYRLLCSELSRNTVQQMKEYLHNGYRIIGLITIGGSPSCDSEGEKGIFIEELNRCMSAESIQISTFDIPELYHDGQSDDIVEKLKKYLRENNTMDH